MGNDKLTMIKALKFARHDFLNELQLILLYIDLGKLPEARQKLLDTTERMRQIACWKNSDCRLLKHGSVRLIGCTVCFLKQ